MGHIGITLLIITGGYLMTPYWSSLTSMPLMIAKLALVLLLVVWIVVLSRASNKAKQGDASQVPKIRGLGNVALLTGIAIVVLAVLQYR
jgi:uncharacterized membrane protein